MGGSGCLPGALEPQGQAVRPADLPGVSQLVLERASKGSLGWKSGDTGAGSGRVWAEEPDRGGAPVPRGPAPSTAPQP